MAQMMRVQLETQEYYTTRWDPCQYCEFRSELVASPARIIIIHVPVSQPATRVRR
jgi:hypothetical protein